jgi:hypothetical protein
MTMPVAFARPGEMPIEYRVLALSRKLYLVFVVLFFAVIAGALWSSPPDSVGLVIFAGTSVVIGVPFSVFWTCFRWVFLKRAATRAAIEHVSQPTLIFSRVGISRAAGGVDVYGPGWILFDTDSLAIWVAATTLSPRADARLVREFPRKAIVGFSRQIVADGRAYSRLRVELHDAYVDVALVNANGTSIGGVSDREVSRIVTQLRQHVLQA